MDETAAGDLLAALMAELRVMARRLLAGEGKAQSIESMDLINSVIGDMLSSGFDWNEATWENRRYVLGVAYKKMEWKLFDHARKRNAGRRLPPNRRVHVDQIQLQNLAYTANEQPERIEALLEALELMELRHPEWAELTRHRLLSQLELNEAAKIMSLSPRTAGRYWERARSYLYHEILRILNEDVPTSKVDPDESTNG
jgi:hypothetical protein